MDPDLSPSAAGSDAAFPLQRVQTTQGAVAYRRSGAGAAHVLLHGIGSSSASWLAQLAAVEGRSDVELLAWDAPGYGQSDRLAQPQPQAEAYAQRLWAWLDALQIQGPVVLAGHSLGAIMAARAAVLRPERVQHLLLLAPARGYGAAPAGDRERVLSTRLGQLAQWGPQGLAQSRAAAMLSPQARPEWVEQVRRQMAAIDPAGYTQAVYLLADAKLHEDLLLLRERGLRMSVASGQADGVTPPAACDAVAAAAGVARISLGEVGHACAIEAAQAVTDLICGQATQGRA